MVPDPSAAAEPASEAVVRPVGVRVLRRERRRAWKGTKTGRHATRRVKTVYGRGQASPT